MKDKIKFEIDYKNQEINPLLLCYKKTGYLKNCADMFELPIGSKPELNDNVKIEFSDAYLYGRIVLIMNMQSGNFKVNVNFIDLEEKGN